MLKFFTNSFKGNASDSIAINPEYVISVFESFNIDQETKEEVRVTNIFTGIVTLQVEDSYLDVVARLNERD